MKYFSLFSGIGGFELGIQPALYRELKYRVPIPPTIGYVPCDKCMKNL